MGIYVLKVVCQEYRSLATKERNRSERGQDVEEGGDSPAGSWDLGNRGGTAKGLDQWGSTETEGAALTETENGR